MPSPALLITQCLQNDFVEPISRYESIPNELHVGFSEAARIMGENPREGALSQVMRWAYASPDSDVRIIHIRDWHDPDDPNQAEHLERFGRHCIANSKGADFAFEVPASTNKDVVIVNSLSLNDFVGTSLPEALDSVGNQPVRVGVMGVWTEAKISFLCYDLVTRYPNFELAVCSALTASSSRNRHFEALEQLRRILGVKIFDSVGQFVEFLNGDAHELDLGPASGPGPSITTANLRLSTEDEPLIRYLFRQCKSVSLDILDGGFSGNLVARASSIDLHGHQQVPYVVKIGPQTDIGRERASFEKIQEVLGNNAPSIADFVDFGDRGAIKYRYASMGGGFSSSFQKMYQGGAPDDDVAAVLDTVFGDQLMRLYSNATLESCDLLEHYAFSPKWAPSVRAKVEAILEHPATDDEITIAGDIIAKNVCHFYERFLSNLPSRPRDEIYMATVHGDLNGANIVIDGHNNVWLIDFFHTRRAHVLMDLIKLENDILYIFTRVDDHAALREAIAVTDALMNIRDLAAPLGAAPSSHPEMRRAWSTIAKLRSFYSELIKADRDVLQLWVAQLRYSVHTLSFDECSALQKEWALYASCVAAERITDYLTSSTRLRVDWIERSWPGTGRIGLTILPGRRDRGRHLAEDIRALKDQGVSRILCLVPPGELESYGVPDLISTYDEARLPSFHLPIVDQMVPSVEDLTTALRWLDAQVQGGESVLVHCVGGLGRSGLAAAAYLRCFGASDRQAIAVVRDARGPRAVETCLQEDFLADFPPSALD